MGAISHSTGAHAGLYRKAPALHEVRAAKTKISKSTVEGDLYASQERSDRKGAQGAPSIGSLLQVLHDSKKAARLSPHSGPKKLQSVVKDQDIQDGDVVLSAANVVERGFSHHHRLMRRILSHKNPRSAQEISALPSGRQGLPIQGSTVRPEVSTKSIYKGPGPSGSSFTQVRAESFPVPRRLVDRGTFRETCQGAHGAVPSGAAVPRFCHKRGKVATAACQTKSVSGDLTGHQQRPGQAIRREDRVTEGIDPGFTKNRLCYSESSEIMLREDVLMHWNRSTGTASDEASAGDGVGSVGSGLWPLGRDNLSRRRYERTTELVASRKASIAGGPLSSSETRGGGDDGRIPARMGRSPRRQASARPVGTAGATATHQCAGTDGGAAVPAQFPTSAAGEGGKSVDRQYHYHVLHSETRRDKICSPLKDSTGLVEMGSATRHVAAGRSHSRGAECGSGCAQQTVRGIARVGAGPGGAGRDIQLLGPAIDGHVCHSTEQQVRPVCIEIQREGVSGGCDDDGMAGERHSLRIPTDSFAAQGDSENQRLQQPGYSGGPGVGQTTVVRRTSVHVTSTLCETAQQTGLAEQRGRPSASPRPEQYATESMAPERLEFGHLDLGDDCMAILGQARAGSTRKTYCLKWKRFCIWAKGQGLHPVFCEIKDLLSYLLALAESGLQHSSIRVHLAAITRYRKRPGELSIFSLPVVKQFLKGLLRTFPPVKRPVPCWELNVVLAALMKAPFEPMSSVDLNFVTMKVAFLVAITSARRIGELQALSVKAPFLRFDKDKVVLRMNPQFVPKVVSAFHLNESIVLPVFFPKPASPAERTMHCLDVRRALRFYLNRTESFRKSDQLLVAFGGPSKGGPISKQGIARWIVQCITTAYQKAGRRLPGRVTAHSTRSKAATAAFLANVPVLDICKAATWRSVHVFTKHYCVDTAARTDAAVGQAALRNIFR